MAAFACRRATGLPGDAPASAIPGPLPPPGSPPKRPDSKEAKEAAFFDLLRETGVTPFSRWEKVQPAPAALPSSTRDTRANTAVGPETPLQIDKWHRGSGSSRCFSDRGF